MALRFHLISYFQNFGERNGDKLKHEIIIMLESYNL